MLKRLIKILGFAILCCNSFAASGNSFERKPLISDLGTYFCAGEFDKVIQFADEMKPNSDGYVAAQLYALAAKRSELNISTLSFSDESIAKMTSLDRLLTAAKLMRAEFKDRLLIKKILSFHSADPVVESYRLYQEAALEQDESPARALDKMMKAFSLLPYLDSTLLHEIFLAGMRQKYPLLVLRSFFPYINSFPENSSDYNLLMADKDYVLSKAEDRKPDISFAKKAYELCRYNYDVALFYANLLIREKQYSEAEKALLPIVEKVPQYSPYVDLFLAKIYVALNDKEKAKDFLERAEGSGEYLSKAYQSDLKKMRDEVQSKNYFLYVALGFVVIFFTALLFKKRKIDRK